MRAICVRLQGHCFGSHPGSRQPTRAAFNPGRSIPYGSFGTETSSNYPRHFFEDPRLKSRLDEGLNRTDEFRKTPYSRTELTNTGRLTGWVRPGFGAGECNTEKPLLTSGVRKSVLS